VYSILQGMSLAMPSIATLTPQNFAEVHACLEFGQAIGKLVLSGFVQ
jgi:hypothetical protein